MEIGNVILINYKNRFSHMLITINYTGKID